MDKLTYVFPLATAAFLLLLFSELVPLLREPLPAPRAEDRRWVRIAKKIWTVLKKAVEYGNRNHFQIHRKEETVLELPVTVLVILIIAAFWVTIPLLVLGLFLGCRYSFIGPDLGKAIVNGAMDAAAKTAEKVKEEVAKD